MLVDLHIDGARASARGPRLAGGQAESAGRWPRAFLVGLGRADVGRKTKASVSSAQARLRAARRCAARGRLSGTRWQRYAPALAPRRTLRRRGRPTTQKRPSWFKLLGLESFQENQESVGIGEIFKKSAGGARARRRRFAIPAAFASLAIASVFTGR